MNNNVSSETESFCSPTKPAQEVEIQFFHQCQFPSTSPSVSLGRFGLKDLSVLNNMASLQASDIRGSTEERAVCSHTGGKTSWLNLLRGIVILQHGDFLRGF